MTKKLETLFNLDTPEEVEPLLEPTVEDQTPIPVIDLQHKLEEFDKINSALPKVKGLGDISDNELDSLAAKAEQAYNDLMDLGMQVEARYGPRIFEVANTMLNSAITAKNAKILNKLRMVELQIKKLAVDKKHEGKDKEQIEGEGYVITDRNSILKKLKDLNK